MLMDLFHAAKSCTFSANGLHRAAKEVCNNCCGTYVMHRTGKSSNSVALRPAPENDLYNVF